MLSQLPVLSVIDVATAVLSLSSCSLSSSYGACMSWLEHHVTPSSFDRSPRFVDHSSQGLECAFHKLSQMVTLFDNNLLVNVI